MTNIVENSIVKLYNNYLDVVDGSNEALLEAWLERIKVCGGNDAKKTVFSIIKFISKKIQSLMILTRYQ